MSNSVAAALTAAATGLAAARRWAANGHRNLLAHNSRYTTGSRVGHLLGHTTLDRNGLRVAHRLADGVGNTLAALLTLVTARRVRNLLCMAFFH